MTGKQKIEMMAKDAFLARALNWTVLSVQENIPSETWDIAVRVPNAPDVIFGISNGSEEAMRKSIDQHVQYKLNKLGSN